jgi:hypothetical protein
MDAVQFLENIVHFDSYTRYILLHVGKLHLLVGT